MTELWERAATGRAEVACGGGRGRTGTALACLAVLDGVPPGEAVAYVRRHYDRRAVETPWQKRYVTRFLSLPTDRAAPQHEHQAEAGQEQRGTGDQRGGDR